MCKKVQDEIQHCSSQKKSAVRIQRAYSTLDLHDLKRRFIFFASAYLQLLLFFSVNSAFRMTKMCVMSKIHHIKAVEYLHKSNKRPRLSETFQSSFFCIACHLWPYVFTCLLKRFNNGGEERYVPVITARYTYGGGCQQ